MNKVIGLTIIAATLLSTPTRGAANLGLTRVGSGQNQFTILVTDGGWGDAPAREIQAVLYATADELLKYFPDRRLHPIIVEHDEAGPITLYRRGPHKEYIVRLNVEGKNWAQLAYQFSHELTHVLARGESLKANQHPNKWFEEALCVTASLFTLRRMAVTRSRVPPFPGWEEYAPFLGRYAEHHLGKPGRQLPPGVTLAKWYKENADNLRNRGERTADARTKQYVIASQLLPIFELHPDLWESVSYLNIGGPNRSYSFEEYLNRWHANSPEKQKRIIREIIDMFRGESF